MKFRLASLLLTLALSAAPAIAQEPALPAISQAEAQLQAFESEISYRIVGGSLAKEKAWPWQVAVYMRRPSGAVSFLCGGSIIHERWVLTAAHCIGPKDAGSYFVVESTNRIDKVLSRNSRGRVLRVSRVISHEAYNNRTYENDIALLQLQAPARSSRVMLQVDAGGPAEKALATATGWGTLRAIRRDGTDLVTHEIVRPNDPRYFTDRLMEVELPIVSEQSCREAYARMNSNIDARVVCAGMVEGGKDSCQGDSGGPLVIQDASGGYRQVGVVSFGDGCGKPGAYGVYSRVSAFQDWLRGSSGLTADELNAAIQTPTPVEAAQPVPAAPSVSDPAYNAAGLSVGFVQGDVLKVGQSAQFQISAKKSGYLLLVDVTPDGRMTQIYPNARSLSIAPGRQKSNYIEAGRVLRVPDAQNPYEGFQFKVEPPFGEGLLVAVHTTEPIRSLKLPEAPLTMDRPAALEYFAQLTEELRRNLEVGSTQKSGVWSFVAQTYRVAQ